MWTLVLSLALAPSFVPHVTRTVYLTEQDCRRALAKEIDADARDGVIVIGKCEPKR